MVGLGMAEEETYVKFRRKRKSWVSSDRSMSPTSGPRGMTSSSISAMMNLQFLDENQESVIEIVSKRMSRATISECKTLKHSIRLMDPTKHF